MRRKIESFDGDYRFLSNFYAPAPVVFDDKTYPTVEHAYQAAKTINPSERYRIEIASTAATAKKLGKTVMIRHNWESIKVDVMRDLISQKFTPGSPLAALLVATGDAEIVEGNWWGDTFWGVCRGRGENRLGHILMARREEARREELGRAP